MARPKKMNMAYVCCSNDEYELPIYITRTAKEMAEELGITEASVNKFINRIKMGKKTVLNYKVYRIKVNKDFWREE